MNLRLTRVGVRLGLAALAAGLLAPAVSVAQVAPQTVGAGAPVAESAAHLIRDAMAERKAKRDAERAAEKARRQAVAQASSAPASGSAPAAGSAPSPGAAGTMPAAVPATTAPARRGLKVGPAPAPASSSDNSGFSGSLETPKPGFLHPTAPGLSYTVDLSSAFPYGNVGLRNNHLKGGFDGQVFIAPEKYTRLLAGYYEVDLEAPGFDTGNIPTYIQNNLIGAPPNPGQFNFNRTNCQVLPVGQGNPICPAPLNTLQNDSSVQQRVFILSLQKIIYIAGLVPIVISPTYIAERSAIGGADDVFLAYNPPTQTYSPVHLRSGQQKTIFLSLPFANSSKLFGVFTAGPAWNVNTCCNNSAGNAAQIFEEMDLRYFATPSTTIFFQPSRLQQYYPEDPYQQNEATFIEGVNHKIGGPSSPFFIQGFIVSGNSTNPPYGNTGRIGTIDATCIGQFPTCATLSGANPRTNTAVTFGGFRATNVFLQVGFGNPSVIPI